MELPDAIDDAQAAALGVVGITAALALDRAQIAKDERVLVLGATGAVGQAAVQLARASGAGRIVAAGRSSEGLERALELGADRAVTLDDYESLAGEFRDAAGGPLHVVVDPLWGPPAMAALTVLADYGRLVNVGQAAGTDVKLPLDQVRNRQGAIHAISSGWTPVPEKAPVYRRLLERRERGPACHRSRADPVRRGRGCLAAAGRVAEPQARDPGRRGLKWIWSDGPCRGARTRAS